MDFINFIIEVGHFFRSSKLDRILKTQKVKICIDVNNLYKRPPII